MSAHYLEVCYRRGIPFAAYFALAGVERRRVLRSREIEPGVIVDFDRAGLPVGIELTDPTRMSVVRMNRILRSLGQPSVTRRELAPLGVA